jgi:hypothetical protein
MLEVVNLAEEEYKIDLTKNSHRTIWNHFTQEEQQTATLICSG